MTTDAWQAWAAARPPSRLTHLDTAAAGRSSYATLQAASDHARLEAEVGAYEAEARAATALTGLRDDLGLLLGVPADGVALVESAAAARDALLGAWPLPDGARIATVPGEWGPNLEAFAHRGLAQVPLRVDADGVIDLDALASLLQRDPPYVVHLSQVAAHRGLVQPVAEVVALCRDAGVLVWVDAAQALGQVDAATGADAVYATSRTWLTGPRGIGGLAVAEPHWDGLRLLRPAKLPGLPPVRYAESLEAHVAGRVGLAVAVRELLDLGLDRVHMRLGELGARAHELLADLPGWEVLGPVAGQTSIVGLRPTAGQDVVRTRAALLEEHAVLTTSILPWRAPGELRVPHLRLSPHVDCTDDDLLRLRSALTSH